MTLVAAAPVRSPVHAILLLALAPAIGLGIGRFAYSLVLPTCATACTGPIPRPDS